MNFSLKLLLFLTTYSLIASGTTFAADMYRVDGTPIIDCSACFTDSSARSEVLNAPYGTGDHLVFNAASGLLWTFSKVSIYNRRTRTYVDRAILVETKQEHLNDFNKLLDWIWPWSDPEILSTTINAAYSTSEDLIIQSEINQFLYEEYGNGWFTGYNVPNRIGTIVNVTTADGYTMVVVKFSTHGTAMNKVITVIDPDGNIVYADSQSETTTYSSGGGGGPSFTIGYNFYGNLITITYSSEVREGTVIIRQNESEDED